MVWAHIIDESGRHIMLNAQTIMNVVRNLSDSIYETISEEYPENLLHSFEDQVVIARAVTTGNTFGNDDELAAMYASEHGTIDEWAASVAEIDDNFRMARLQLTALYKAAVAIAPQAEADPAVGATAIQSLMAQTQTLILSITEEGSEAQIDLLAELELTGQRFQATLEEAASESAPNADEPTDSELDAIEDADENAG